jgi:two-component system response regulator AtoC
MGAPIESQRPSVLLIAPVEGASLAALLVTHGARATVTRAPEQALAKLDASPFDGVLMELAGDAALTTLAEFVRRVPDVPVIACGPATINAGGAAFAAGAASFVALPASAQEIGLAIDTALSQPERASVAPPRRTADAVLLGDSPHLAALRQKVARAAPGKSTILLRGETGSGKELVARELHAQSARRARPFLPIHAAAVPETLLESELFGYEKGAFTGASVRKVGRIELAEGGTLFLDEIGELSLTTQAKLLRLIQEREYERLGGTSTLRADVRIIAATHRDLEDMVARGTFREDLFYRLNVVALWVPPLRARRDDIRLIARHYFDVFRVDHLRPNLRLDEEALHLLERQRWPGNVRQLVNFVERLVVLSSSELITAVDVQRDLEEHYAFVTQANGGNDAHGAHPEVLTPAAAPSPVEADDPGPVATDQLSSAVRPLREDLRRAEHRAIAKALRAANGNRSLAARMLGISRRALYTKMGEHDLE